MIERIKLTSLRDSHFCALENHRRHYRNARFRTLMLEKWFIGPAGRGGLRSINVVQVANLAELRKLKFRFADEVQGVASSTIERCLDRLEFGLGDINQEAQYLLLSYEKHGSPGSIAKWLKNNCERDVVMLEGARDAVRVSFESDDDYILARLNFS